MRLVIAAIGILLFATSANASCNYTNDGKTLCNNVKAIHSIYGKREASRDCPRYLGCGCNLANDLGGIGRFGHKVWRELWVARNWMHIGNRDSRGCIGCIAVLSRGRRGGHVGIVRSYDGSGNPVIYSYANGRLGWTTTSYSARRVIGYRSL